MRRKLIQGGTVSVAPVDQQPRNRAWLSHTDCQEDSGKRVPVQADWSRRLVLMTTQSGKGLRVGRAVLPLARAEGAPQLVAQATGTNSSMKLPASVPESSAQRIP